MRLFIPAKELRCRENSDLVSYACLAGSKKAIIYTHNARYTHCITVSVIWCELSIRLRSANNESAADDLYALKRLVSYRWKFMDTHIHTLYHCAPRKGGLPAQARVWRLSVKTESVRHNAFQCAAMTFVRFSSRILSCCSSRCLWIARSIELDMRSGFLASCASCSLISSNYNHSEFPRQR